MTNITLVKLDESQTYYITINGIIMGEVLPLSAIKFIKKYSHVKQQPLFNANGVYWEYKNP